MAPGTHSAWHNAVMRFWFAHGSDVPIPEQLFTQVVLGILSEDLAPGQKLPSTRELARRFHLHFNTVSAGYRKLEHHHWVEFRHGSGVYIRDKRPDTALSPVFALDEAIARVFQTGQKLGLSLYDVRSRLRHLLELQPPDHFLLIEPDENLRQIVVAEIQSAVTLPVRGCDIEGASSSKILEGAIVVVLPRKAAALRQVLPVNADVHVLQVRSANNELGKYLPASPDVLIGIASRWDEFLEIARTMLIAAGFDSDRLLLRDGKKLSWQKGLDQTEGVVCDSLTAVTLNKKLHAIPFRLIAESSLQDLKRHEQFITALDLRSCASEALDQGLPAGNRRQG